VFGFYNFLGSYSFFKIGEGGFSKFCSPLHLPLMHIISNEHISTEFSLFCECSAGRNGTVVNGTSLAPSSNSTSSGCLSLYLHGDGSFTSSVIVGVLLLSTAVLF
jgi:hypothetical protein